MVQNIDVETRSQRPAVSMRFECTPKAMATNLEKILPLVAAYTQSRGGVIEDPPFLRYHAHIDGQFYLEAGFPVSEGIPDNSLVDMTELPGGTVVVGTHVGPYRNLGASHKEIREWIRSGDYEPAGPCWDYYVDDPEHVDEESLRTEIIYPVRKLPDATRK